MIQNLWIRRTESLKVKSLKNGRKNFPKIFKNSKFKFFYSFSKFFTSNIHQHSQFTSNQAENWKYGKLYSSLAALCHYATCVSYSYTIIIAWLTIHYEQHSQHLTDQATRMLKKFNAIFFISFNITKNIYMQYNFSLHITCNVNKYISI